MIPDVNTDLISTQSIWSPDTNEKGLTVEVLRLDPIHEFISGNKWFKLRFFLEEAKTLKKKKIVTWGGAWSNHIIATAAAANLQGFSSVGLIRGGAEHYSSQALQDAQKMGMELIFQSRSDFDEARIPESLNEPGNYFVPAGGNSETGVRGAATILDHCPKNSYSHFCLAVGTGTMAAGILRSLHADQQLVGIAVVKNQPVLENEIREKSGVRESSFHLIDDYHFGGYAKKDNQLIGFMNELWEQERVPSDFVYTGKLFFAIHKLVRENYFPPGSRVLIIHSGGLRGNLSLDKGTLIF